MGSALGLGGQSGQRDEEWGEHLVSELQVYFRGIPHGILAQYRERHLVAEPDGEAALKSAILGIPAAEVDVLVEAQLHICCFLPRPSFHPQARLGCARIAPAEQLLRMKGRRRKETTKS